MSNEKQFLGWLPFANYALAVLVVFIHSYNAKDYGLNYADSSR